MSKKSSDLESIQKTIQIHFRKPGLLKNALIHRSYLNEHKELKLDSNERLEFLGDAVLSLIVSKHLYEKLPQSPEGELTQFRASLVRTETLAILAKKLELGKYLYLSKGEEESGGRNNQTILADAFESLIGSIYIDQGITTVQDFVSRHILANWQKLTQGAITDYKSKLQEMLQKHYRQSPVYKLLKSWGPDHNRSFEIGVYLAEELLGKGTGKNKQIAAQNAAQEALTRLKT